METPTIAEAARLFAEHKLSPVELTQACIDKIEALDGTFHAFIATTPERALADALAAEARIMAGKALGPLDGIPIAHKDIYGTKGIATTAHSKLLQGWVPTEDAVTVTKLADAGIAMLGKLATHEFAMGGPSFDLPWPPARNPWNPDHFTSGSSSGTGAAVAAGMILGGTGSDTGGSIRGPASLCGIAGIKPTYGLCSRVGILPLSQSLDHAGPMAWNVQDCAILLQAMAGYDPTDPASANRPVPDFSAGLGRDAKGMKIGVVRHWHETDAPVAEAVQKGIDDAVAIWTAQGAEIIEIVLPSLFEFQACCSVILTSEAYAVHEPWMKTRFNDYGERLRMRLATGALMTSADYVQALRRRLELCTIVAQATKGIDILITAGAQAEAPRIEGMALWVNADKPGFTAPFNVLGWPAMAICSGFGVGGLPVAIQIAAKPFQEAKLFQVADAFEQATNFRATRPSLVATPPGLATGLAAAGLNLPASDMAGLDEVVADLTTTAASLQGDRSYAVEPANVFTLRKDA